MLLFFHRRHLCVLVVTLPKVIKGLASNSLSNVDYTHTNLLQTRSEVQPGEFIGLGGQALDTALPCPGCSTFAINYLGCLFAFMHAQMHSR